MIKKILYKQLKKIKDARKRASIPHYNFWHFAKCNEKIHLMVDNKPIRREAIGLVIILNMGRYLQFF